MNQFSFPQLPPFVFLALYIWSLVWKGIALWHASKNNQKNWFIAMLVLNTVGILELVYLFVFAKPKFKIEKLKFWQTKI